jgi:hypothetical protein
MMIVKSLRYILLLSVFLSAGAADAQTAERAQATPPSELTVDESFDPPIAAPAFRAGKGPMVVVDEKHRNVVSLKTYPNSARTGAWSLVPTSARTAQREARAARDSLARM